MATKKKVSVVVDIQGQAQSLQKVIEQAQKNLGDLHLNPKIYQDMQRATKRMIQDLQKVSLAGSQGLQSDTQIGNQKKTLAKISNDFSNMISQIKGLGIKVEDIFPETEEFQKLLKEQLAAYETYQKKLKQIREKNSEKVTNKTEERFRKAAKAGDVEGVKKAERSELAKLSKKENIADARNTINELAKTLKISFKEAMAKLKEEVETYEGKTSQGKAEFTRTTNKANEQGIKRNFRVEADAFKTYKQYDNDRQAIKDVSTDYQAEANQVLQLQNSYDKLSQKMQELAGPTQQKVQQAMNEIYGAEEKVEQNTREMGEAFDKAGTDLQELSAKQSSLNQLKSYFGQMLSATSIVMRLGQAVRGAVEDFKALDKQFNEISIVTGKTMGEMWDTFASVNKVAQEYGVTSKDVVSVQKLYYQQGRKTADVTKLTAETLKFAKISSLDYADATEYMTATLNAYNLEASEASRITDVFAALASTAAAEAKEISIAMSKVASLSAMSGATLEETSAYLTKIIETTREGAEVAGTALKTIEARFTAINKLTDDQKELLSEDYNFNNIEKALKTVGLTVKDETGNIRSFSNIINDLGPMWDNLTSNQQHYIATQAAGARQQSRFIALMNDWGRTQELLDVAATAEGTGSRQLALALDSIETELNKLKATWQEFYTNFIQSDFVKGAIKTLNGLLDVLTKIASVDIVGPYLIAGLALLIMKFGKAAKNAGEIFGKNFQAAYHMEMNKEKIEQDAVDLKYWADKGAREGYSYQKSFEQARDAVRTAEKADDIGTDVIGDIGTKVATEAGTTIKAKKVAGSGAAAAGSSLGAKAASLVNGAKGILSAAAPYIAIFLAIAAGLTLIGKAVNHFANAPIKKQAEELVQAQDKISDTINKTRNATNNYTKALDLHRKGLMRTEQETEDYQAALQKLQEEIPSMVKTLRDGSLELNASSADYDLYIERQKKVVAAQNQAYIGSTRVVGEGLLLSKEGQNAQTNIQSIANALAGMDDDTLASYGLSGISQKDLGILAEKGFTREAVNEMLESVLSSGYNASEFNHMLEEYAKTGSLNTGANAYGEDKFLNWLTLGIGGAFANDAVNNDFKALVNVLNDLAGYDVIKELADANDPDIVRKVQVENITDLQDAIYGTQTSEFTEKAFADMYGYANNPELLTADFMNNYIQERAAFALSDWKTILGDKYKGDIELISEEGAKLFEQLAYYNIIPTGEASGITFEQVKNGEYSEYKLEDSPIYTVSEKIKEIIEGGDIKEADVNAFLDSLEYAYGSSIEMDDLKSSLIEGYEQKVEKYFSSNSAKSINAIEDYYEKIITSLTGNEINDNNIDEIATQLGIDKDSLVVVQGAFQNAVAERNEKVAEFAELMNQATDGAFTSANFEKYSVNQLESFGPQVTRVSQLYGQKAAKDFWTEYQKYNNEYLSNLPSEFRDAYAQVEFTDAASISAHAARLQMAGLTEELDQFIATVEKAGTIENRVFKTMEEQLTACKSKVESLSKSFDNLNKGIEGSLSFEEMTELLTQIPGLSVEDFTATTEGIALDPEKALKAKQDSLKLSQLELQYEIEQYKIAQAKLDITTQDNLKRLQNLDEQIKSGQLTQQQYNEIQAQRNALLTDDKTEAAYNQWVALQEGKEILEATQIAYTALMNEMEGGTKGKEIKRLEKLLELYEKIEEYADINAYISSLEKDLAKSEFQIEFSSNIDTVAAAAKNKLDSLNNLLSSNLAKSQHAQQNVDKMKENLSSQWGDYVSFDESGNLLTNEDAIYAWADSIAERSISTTGEDKLWVEMEEARLDLLLDQIDAYREEKDLVEDCESAARDYLKQIEDFTKELRENVVELEDKFYDLFVKRDEAALESLEKRYDAAKELDNEYLESVREAIEKERELRDQSKDYEDLAKKEKKLQLLMMSGGSQVEIQKLQEEIADSRQQLNDKEVDNILNSIEESNEARAAAMDEEVEYEQMVLEEKKKNRILYNQEIENLMRQDKETIMATWKSLDDEFLTSTETNKELLEGAMDQMVTSAKGAQQALTDPSGYITAIEDAYKDVKESGIDEVDKAMTTYVQNVSGQKDTAVKGIGDIKDAYFNVEKQIDKVINAHNALVTAQKNNSIVVKNNDNYDTETIGSNTENQEPSSVQKRVKKFTRNGTDYYMDMDTGGYYKASDIDKGLFDNFKEGLVTLKNDAQLIEFSSDDTKFKDQDLFYTKDIILTPYVYDSSTDNMFDSGNFPDGTFNLTGYKNVGNTQYYLTDKLSKSGQPIWISRADLIRLLKKQKKDSDYGENTDFGTLFGLAPKYAKGGLVDFTGPAWVDGTKTKPEAFLSANDTALIAQLTDVLSLRAVSLKPSQLTPNNGDTYYEIYINVDELGDGYSVDDLMDELEERIIQATGNSSAIKIKR